MATAWDTGDISKLVSRFSNELLHEQALMNAPVLGMGNVGDKSRKVVEIIKKGGVKGNLNIKAGGVSSVKWIGDGDSLPSGADVTPVQVQYNPAILFGRLSLPRYASRHVSSKRDGVELVKEECDSVSAQMGATLGRAFFGVQLASPIGNVAIAATSFTVSSAAGYIVGAKYDAMTGSTVTESFVVASITIPADPTQPATINLTAAISNAFTGLAIYQHGSYADGMIGLSDVCAAASLYGQAQTAYEWSGNLDSSTTTLATTPMQNLSALTRMRRGTGPKNEWSAVLTNPVNVVRYNNLLNQNRRFTNQGVMDGPGKVGMIEFEGKPVIEDHNCGEADLFLFNENDVKLHQFHPFAPDTDQGQHPGMGLQGSVLDSSNYSYDIQISGAFQLRVKRRNGTARMSAIAA